MQNYINQANSQNINTNLIKINLSEPIPTIQIPKYKTLPVKTVYDDREGKVSSQSILNLNTEFTNVFFYLTFLVSSNCEYKGKLKRYDSKHKRVRLF